MRSKHFLLTGMVIGLAIVLSGCCFEHAWVDATCTTPKTCSECGKTEGEPIAHRWQGATCAEPKHCADCDATQGDVIAHTWTDATCTEPKTCSACGTTEGEALGHTPDEMQLVERNYGEGEEKYAASCTICGQVLHTETVEMTTYVSDEHFMMSPAEFVDSFNARNYYIDAFDYTARLVTSGESLVCLFHDDDDNLVAAMMFYGSDGFMSPSAKDDADTLIFMMAQLADDYHTIHNFIQLMVHAVDPGAGNFGGFITAGEVMDAVNATVHYNDVHYLFGYDDGNPRLVVSAYNKA